MFNYKVLLIFCVSISCGNGVPRIFRNVFDLECPGGFLQNEVKTHCLLEKTSKMKACPKLIDLNITYSLIPKSSLIEQTNRNKSYCSYSWEDIFSTASEDNNVTLNLIFSNFQQPFDLYLDITTKRPVNDIEKKIHCWVYYKSTPIQVRFIKKYSDLLTSRYRLDINKNFQQYVCYFLDAGKIPLNYTSRFASTNANYIFNAQIHQIPYASCAQQLSKDFNVYGTNLIDYKSIVGMSSKLTITEAIRDFNNKIPDGICKDNVTNITNNEFCLPIVTPISGTNKSVFWPLTRAGQKAFSNSICLDIDNKPLARECIKSINTTFGECRWSSLEQDCINSHSPINTVFENILDHNITDSELTQISDLIKNSTINEYEVDYITKILSAAVYTSNESTILETIDNVLQVDDKVLNASKSFGTTEKIFDNIDMVVQKLVKNQSEVSITLKNIGVIVHTVIQVKHDKNKTDVEVTIKENNEKNTLVQVKLSNNFLTSFNLSGKDQEEIMISVISYNSKIFNNEANLHQIGVDVNLYPKIIFRNRFKEPLSIFFTTKKQKVFCVFWDEVANNWLTSDVETKLINSTTVECQTYHLTRFSLLIIEDRIVGQISYVHEIISTVENVLSFICVLIILFLAMFSRKFAIERPRTVHLSFIILLENILILIEEYIPGMKHDLNCKLMGIFLHYIVLVKFFLTLMITKAQLNNFVYFIGLKKADKCFTPQETFTVWILPALFISVGVVVSHDKYNLGMNNFCYPKDELFYFFVVVPIGIIALINFIALLWICANLTCRKTKTEKDIINQLRLCVMLIFMLDIVWLLGVLVNIINEGVIHDIFKYCHYFIAPLQGTMVFIFTVNSYFNCGRGQNNHSFLLFGMKNK